MRRGTSLTSRLARIALAYALALQALLGAFAGVAVAAGSGGFDPALSLCRTIANDERQPSTDHDGPVTHCAAMCLTGVCAAGDPPLAASAAIEFPPFLVAFMVRFATDDQDASPALFHGLNARGPPSIA